MTYKLYHGSSPYLSLKALKKEANTYDIGFQVINAEITDSQNIFDSLSSRSLFSSQKGLIIKRLYKNKDKERLIENILVLLKNDSSTNILLFWEDEKVRSTTKYYKFFKSKSLVEEYDEMNKRSFMSWLKEELKDENINIDTVTQKILAEKTNYDPERCTNEIQKMKLDPDFNLENISNTFENDIWSLIDAINTKDKAKSMNILENLYTQNNDPNYILSMIARNLRLLTLVKYLNEKGSSFKEICSTLRIPPFTLPTILDTSKRYDKKAIIQIYQKLANLDKQIKTGKINGQLGLTLICPYL